MVTTFNKYIREGKLKGRTVKVKRPDLNKDKRFKSNRGVDRKHLNLVPDVRKSEGSVFSSIDDVIKRAKDANRGIWQVSKRQVIDIAKKYKFLIPNDYYPTKHLGSTGIILWRKEPNKYFLVKKRKQRYNRGM